MGNEENKTETAETIVENKLEIVKPKKKFNKKKFFISLGIVVFLIYGLYIFILSRPLKGDNIFCSFKGKYNKIVCIQTGDIVPEWLELDDNPYLKYLGISNAYSMKLILSHDTKTYKVLNMVDKEFVVDMNRKFIYELKEQTFGDWLDFKKFALGSKVNNWGSIVLYCSNSNLQEDVCKEMKKRYKK